MILQKSARPEDRGGISAGYWQGRIRDAALELCLSPKPGRTLEAGCGEGLFLGKALKADPALSVFGVDISFDQLRGARKRIAAVPGARAGLVRADAMALPFKDNTFDKAVAINIVLNMPSEAMISGLIRELARVCRDGGSVIFDIRNASSPLIRIKYRLAPLYDATIKEKGLALRACHPDAIEKELAAAGLRVIRKISIGFPKGKFAPVVIIEAGKGKI